MTQSRLIPGAPALPSMGPMAGPGMATGAIPSSSLFGRETPPAPVTPVTQMLSPAAAPGLPSLNLGASLGDASTGMAPASPMPRGRSISALRSPRGTNFIRLAIAAVFLLGFLGTAGFFFKDAIMGAFAGSDAPEKTPAVPALPKPNPVAESSSSPPEKTVTTTVPEAPKPESASETGAGGMVAGVETKIPVTQSLGLDQNTTGIVPPRAQPATQDEIKAATATGTVAMVSPPPATPKDNDSQPPLTTPPAGEKLLEVPPTAATPVTSAPPGPAAVSGGINDSSVPTSDDIPPKAQPALDALKQFLAASNVADRAKLTLASTEMRPLMERYYSKMSDGPIQVDHIGFSNFDERPDLGSGAHCIFRIENKAWEYPVPVMLEQQPDGWKVDWLTFIELKDRKLEEFFKGYQEGRFMFHVGIYRQHYFEDAVPNRDQKDAFSVGLERPNPFRAPVFLPKETQLAQQLRERLPWEVHVWAIVELEWKKLGSQQWVELVSMPQMHWYFVPTPPKPQAKPVSATEQPAPAMPAEPVPPPLGGPSSSTKSKSSPNSSSKGETFPPGIRRSPATGGR
ncbi:MAG: hypothetical protein JNG86_07460 [Verrucomicrobiaceae bacterium]|nr:hypothetical protein [Verrucomicrobiaceae bacterium]